MTTPFDDGDDVADEQAATPPPPTLTDEVRLLMQEYEVTIVNIVATFDLGLKIDLKDLVMNARNVEYNPRKFGGAIMRLRNPKTTAIVFGTGKVVLVGLNDIDGADFAAQRVETIVRKIGYTDATAKHVTVRNITATANAAHRVRLEGLLLEHARFCSFEPELFPGLYYRMIGPKMCFTIFTSGKVIVCGAKSLVDVGNGFAKLMPVLHQFQMRSRNII
ncbi:Aste57867_17655 [Aphanomyces stellatus]|uniref:Aste57867_17655 protein n=1 Tax=Aphanomyces stellatus TaxID=120398 RepID=A0A485L896_9STRA|nr:hypothetical protein As57867_017594 [Aphanomyces stellatus]VFT94406.1 Aste57867_17655 [Aphanomyces stellatus]